MLKHTVKEWKVVTAAVGNTTIASETKRLNSLSHISLVISQRHVGKPQGRNGIFVFGLHVLSVYMGLNDFVSLY